LIAFFSSGVGRIFPGTISVFIFVVMTLVD
jgi:hypothetical protein